MTIWDELSAEERCALANGADEAYLNGVIPDFLGRSEHGGAVWVFSDDEAAVRA